MSALIECRGLTRTYHKGDIEIRPVDGLDLDIDDGAFTALMGPSGSGKTTLLNMIAGVDRPTSGVLRIAGTDISALSRSDLAHWRSENVGYIFQLYHLIPVLTAYENVELPMLLTGVPSRARKERSEELLEIVGLAHRRDHKPAQLSGGEQQRVAIAVALANRPPLLLADEPTGELDVDTAAEVLTLLNNVNQELGTTIVIVTHDPAISTSVGRAVAIRDGKTSTETTRAVSFERKLGGDTSDVEEFLLVDSSGSVQIPREVLDDLSIRRRVRLGVTDGRVTLESGE